MSLPGGPRGEEVLELWRQAVNRLRDRPRLGVDTGGTFTDFVLVHGNEIRTWKAPSRPRDPGAPIRETLASGGTEATAATVRIGTTVGTNAAIERKMSRVALVTTAGFEDLIELGRQTRASLYALNPPVQDPLVPRDLRYGVDERMLADGSIDSSLDPRKVRDLLGWVDASGADAVAVLFLHSVTNDAHEQAVGTALRAARPERPVTLSSEILSEPREYERLCAAVLNAGLRPVMTRYLEGIEPGDRPMGLAVSSGGVLPADLAAEEPVRAILSGPAAGVAAASRLARSLGIGPLLTFDMGGTSTDVSWVDPESDLALTTEGSVGPWPVALPTVDIVTIGAGGGSIAKRDPAGALTVGPDSAGADPGPAAYGKGGPFTVTDALLVLGLLPAEIPLSGGLVLDRDAAHRAGVDLAARLGRSVEETARAVLDVALAGMERALRKASSARGHDPRAASLLAAGGAGGLVAVELARRLGMKRAIVPPSPGVFSAWGTLGAPTRLDGSLSVRIRAEELDGGSPYGPFWNWLGHFVPALPGESGLFCSFGVRYPGQSRDLIVPAGGGWEEVFHAAHERRSGYARRPLRPIVTTLRVSIRYEEPEPPLPGPAPPEKDPGPPRRVVFAGGVAAVTPVVSRTTLENNATLPGPAIVVEKGSAVVVPPGATLRTGAGDVLILEV